MQEPKQVFTRRQMFNFAALVGGAGVLSVGAGMVGCAPKNTSEPSAQNKSSKSDSITWDKTVDFVVAGSGCGVYAAIAAAHEGASVCVVEKADTIGGTTLLSGNMCWVPNNAHMKGVGVEEFPEAKIVDYLRAADAFRNANESLLSHYVKHASAAFSYLEESVGLPMGVRMSMPLRGDYYNLEGALEQGRSMDFLSKEGKPAGSKTFEEIIWPKAESLGVEALTGTAITELILGKSGEVVGVVGKSSKKEIFIKAEKGLILATGGFDWNEDMIRAFHRGPLFISVGVKTNTGDGQLLGMAAGAGLSNMQNSWGVQAIITDAAEKTSTLSDWGTARSKPNSLMVNRRGRRFTNEASSYSTCNPSFYAYDSATCDYLNMPAYLVFDQTYVDFYGYPGVKAKKDEKPQQPAFVTSYDSLEALAQAQGINSGGLLSEVERFNGFARDGKDVDWHRGEWAFDTKANGDTAGVQQGLANTCMGPVENAPFYCVEIGPGSCGTSGGLDVNESAQVLKAVNKEPIAGLYALGNCAASIFGSAYPGSGATVGAGVFQGLMAVQHALGYQKY